MTATLCYQTTPETLSEATIESYRQNGFVHIPGVISKEEAAEFREHALAASQRLTPHNAGEIFRQTVNVWRSDPQMRRLTLHPNVAAVAEKLAGSPLRLWHDQILIKAPRHSKPTEFHQDQPYWPHEDSPNPISAWIALCDVPVERGCMTFIPGSHRWTHLPGQRLDDPRSLASLHPEMEWCPRVTLPLRAGDCTFHHGRCAHMATPNFTDDPRVAFVVIYMPDGTRLGPRPHVVTKPLGLQVGDRLEGEMFPKVEEFARLRDGVNRRA